MCYADGYPEFWRESWPQARQEHQCTVCGERIIVGHRYHVATGKWDGEVVSFKHCARCWELYLRLNGEGGDVSLELDCDEVYGGDDEEIHALAFVTPREGQAFVPAKA